MSDWRAGFYAAVADWVRSHNPDLDIASPVIKAITTAGSTS